MNRNNHFAPSRNSDPDLAHFGWFFRPRELRIGRLRFLFCGPATAEGFGVVRIPGERGIVLLCGPWNCWLQWLA